MQLQRINAQIYRHSYVLPEHLRYDLHLQEISIIPLTVTANVHDVLGGGMKPERLASAFGTWNRQPARLSVRVRPTFQNATGRAFRTTGFEPVQALVSLK